MRAVPVQSQPTAVGWMVQEWWQRSSRAVHLLTNSKTPQKWICQRYVKQTIDALLLSIMSSRSSDQLNQEVSHHSLIDLVLLCRGNGNTGCGGQGAPGGL